MKAIIKRRSDHPQQYRLQRYGRADGRKGKRPLIVVHGYAGEIYGMRGYMDLLAQTLPLYAVYEFAFETSLWRRNRGPLEIISRDLAREVQRVIVQDNLERSGAAFIGHSTGGLVARRAFLDAHSDGWDQARFVFLGTPHLGSEVADVKNAVLGFLGGDAQTRDLATASDFIWRLNRDWSLLPGHAVGGTLSVVGTRAGQLKSPANWGPPLLAGLPRGDWVQSDGVVRQTSALLSVTPAQRFTIFVPQEHIDLKEVPSHWRQSGALNKRFQRFSPVPRRDLAILAGIAMLKGDRIASYDHLWVQTLELFEHLEREVHKVRLWENSGYVEWPDGTWMQRGLKPRADRSWIEEPSPEDDMVAVHDQLASWDGDSKRHRRELEEGPRVPEFLDALKCYAEEAIGFLDDRDGKAFGSLLIRFEKVASPKHSRISILPAENQGRSTRRRLSCIVRHGPQWITLWGPELRPGKYVVRCSWGDGGHDQACQVVAEVHAHLATVIEVDTSGFTYVDGGINPGAVASLTDSNERLLADLRGGLDWLKRELESRHWQLSPDETPDDRLIRREAEGPPPT